MANNEDDAEHQARNHKPAIIGILIAVLVAGIAILIYAPWKDETFASKPAGGTAAGDVKSANPPKISPEGSEPTQPDTIPSPQTN